MRPRNRQFELNGRVTEAVPSVGNRIEAQTGALVWTRDERHECRRALSSRSCPQPWPQIPNGNAMQLRIARSERSQRGAAIQAAHWPFHPKSSTNLTLWPIG